jgi:hypothetical protein
MTPDISKCSVFKKQMFGRIIEVISTPVENSGFTPEAKKGKKNRKNHLHF